MYKNEMSLGFIQGRSVEYKLEPNTELRFEVEEEAVVLVEVSEGGR